DQGQDHGDGQCDRRGDEGGDDVLAQGDRDQGGSSDLTDAVPGRQPRRGVCDAHLRADSDRHHGHSDERGAEQGGGDEQHDRGGTEDGQQGTEDLEAVADGQGTDGADASGDEGPQQGRGRGGQTSDKPGRGGRGIAEDGAGQHHEVGADDDVAAALEEVPGREHEHGPPAVGIEGGVGGRVGVVSWIGGGRLGGNPDGDGPGPGDDGEHGGDGRADEPQLTPVGEAAGGQHDRPGDEDAESDSAEDDTSVVAAAGVGRNPLGHAHEDQ